MDWRSWKKTGTKGAEEAERRAEVNYFFFEVRYVRPFSLSLSLFSEKWSTNFDVCV